MSDIILKMEGITKTFPGVLALNQCQFELNAGEIHALVGENGAGKSTLMKILSAVYPAGSYQGKILIDGKEQNFKKIKDSVAAGIAIIYQELMLIRELSIAENICLGNEIAKNGVINWEESYLKAQKALQEVGLNTNPDFPVSYLGVGEQQLVAIAKSLSQEAKILILDEPTAALSAQEADRLLGILKDLRKKGVTCIFISHRLREAFEMQEK